MRITIWTIALGALLLVSLGTRSAVAQTAPKIEVAGGYAYLHETDLSFRPVGSLRSE